MKPSAPHIALEASDLCIGYRKGKKETPVSSGLNLFIRSGELLCLMGPNGAGKSTLLRTLAGVQPPLSGEVRTDSKNIHALSPAERARHISLVLTETISAGNMSVLELVALGRYPHTGWEGGLSEADKDIIRQALEDLGIKELAQRKLYELSDGQQQKALIARALAQDGKLIILDEPTAHLDLINRLQIMRLLRMLALRRQKAIVVATHELDLALQSADRLWLLSPHQQGGLAEGVPEDLVLNGSLAKAFSRTGFHFDPRSGQFTEETEPCVPVQLTGPEPARSWTQKALKRNGYEAVLTPAPVKIEIQEKKENPVWKITRPEGSSVASSVEDMLLKMRSPV